MKQIKQQYLGLLTGTVMIASLLVAFYRFHVPTQSKFQLVVYGIYSAGIILALLSFHQSKQPARKFKDYFSEGFKMFIVVVLMMVIYTFVFVKMNPQILDNFIETNNKALTEQGNRTKDEITENAAKIRSYTPLVMTMGAMIMYLIIGALVTLAGAGFLSQKNIDVGNKAE